MPQLPSDLPALFTGRHFDRLLITQSVRWYITYKPSYRDVSEMMAERGVTVVHTALVQIGSQVEVGYHILGKAHRSFPISCH
jgi:transposase-like protein